jgi:hypothetical protein
VQTLQAEEWARFIYYQSVIFLFFASAWALWRESVNKGTRSLLSVVFAKNINFALGTHIIAIKHLKSILYKISFKKKHVLVRKSKLLKKNHH